MAIAESVKDKAYVAMMEELQAYLEDLEGKFIKGKVDSYLPAIDVEICGTSVRKVCYEAAGIKPEEVRLSSSSNPDPQGEKLRAAGFTEADITDLKMELYERIVARLSNQVMNDLIHHEAA